MPLAVDKGGLIVKDGKLCTTCCGEPPPVPGICLYREDGLGTCTQYNVDETDYGAPDFATKEEAQAWIDEGNCPSPGPDEPDCGMSVCVPYDNGGVWTPIVQYRVPATDQNGNILPCDQWLFTEPSTKEYCESRPAISGSSWQNDLPATDCKIVNSEDECTESTGTFCPDLTECPDDPSAGCPDPNRSNPLP